MTAAIIDIIEKIKQKQTEFGITLYKKATLTEISNFEEVKKIKLPEDIITFYSFCNGFESNEDLFRVIPLNEIIEKGKDEYATEEYDFHFAEYMIYSDMWTISISPIEKDKYSIYNKANNVITLTKSFADFLNRFLEGGVFKGLYKWRDEIEFLQNKI